MKVAIIPARGGSKRIPRKNIKEFFGKPMIAWSIEAAQKSNCFDRIIVSTDDEEIADVAKKYGAELPFIRPAELSDDHAGTASVIKHAISYLKLNDSQPVDILCLYATAPFAQPAEIFKSYEKFQKLRADFCLAVTPYPAPIQRALKLTLHNDLQMFTSKYQNYRSQDLKEAYYDAGQFMWGTAIAFETKTPISSSKTVAHLLPNYLVQDIDTLDDWKRAELLFQVLRLNGDIL